MNWDLDKVKSRIATNKRYGFLFRHSIRQNSTYLTRVELTILYLEDRRFFIHRGIEFKSILRGFRRAITRGRIGGMSTIDQQVVRIALGRYERSFSRKSRELLLAYFLNFHCPKREIFDYYIHSAYLGYKMQGCEIAANKIFRINAASLNDEQAAFVASLFPLPFPRSVWEVYSKHADFPFFRPQDIITLARTIEPRWAERMEYRSKIAAGSYNFMPRSL